MPRCRCTCRKDEEFTSFTKSWCYENGVDEDPGSCKDGSRSIPVEQSRKFEVGGVEERFLPRVRDVRCEREARD